MLRPAVYWNVRINSLSEHARDAYEVPKVDHGIVNPWDPDQEGIRAWRSEWSVVVADAIGDSMLAGKRILQTHLSSAGTFVPLGGNLLIIELDDFVGDATSQSMADGFIQIVTTAKTPSQTVRKYCPPGDVIVGIEHPNKDEVEKDQWRCASRSFAIDLKDGSPELMRLQINPLLNQKYPEGSQIRIHLGIFMAVTRTIGTAARKEYFFDDPEMEVNIP